jgi:serine/threonine-protein kinase
VDTTPANILRGNIATGGSTAAGRTTVPPELLLASVRRLRLLAYVLGGIYVLVALLATILPLLGLMKPPGVGEREFMIFLNDARALQVTGIGLAAVMVAITYWRRLTPETILAIGLVFQVLGSLVFSLADYMFPWGENKIPMGVPRATIWIMAFPLIPSNLRRSAVAAFASAAMGPTAMLIAGAFGRGMLLASTAFIFYLPLFVSAGVATVMAGVMHRLAGDVSRARQLGSYILVEKIAHGGMGEVWKARHGSLIRPAAVKLIRPEILGDKSTAEMGTILRRFVREAQATSLLTSPHTVTLYDFGRTADGTMYYVMELLGGVDLETMVRRFGPLPSERVAYILAQACHSLADAHRIGLVHRDIKPANLQLTVHGGDFDFAKVFDFGLAKRTGETSNTLATADHVITGTPAYLAPEGAAGGKDVDARSDLYSLGCVAYWLLTGKLVFQEETPMAMILAHVKTPPTPPSQRTELPIPEEMDRLVLDLLAKDPLARPASAAEVARRIAGMSLPDAWTQDRAEKWWRTHLPQETKAGLCEGMPKVVETLEEAAAPRVAVN